MQGSVPLNCQSYEPQPTRTLALAFSDMQTSQSHWNAWIATGGMARQNVYTFSKVCANLRTSTSSMDAKPMVLSGNEIAPDLTTISNTADSANAAAIKWGRLPSLARM